MDKQFVTYRSVAGLLLLGLWLLSGLPGCATNRQVNMAALDQQRLLLINIDMPVARPLRVDAGGKPYLGGAYVAPVSATQTLDDIVRDYDLKWVESWPIEALSMHCGLVRVPVTQDVGQLLTRLQQDGRVRLAQVVNHFQTLNSGGPRHNDPYFAAQFDEPDAALAHLHTRMQGENSTVAIVDTGADVNHPDLVRQVAFTRNYVDDNARQFLNDIHGTAVAGIIAAEADNHEGVVGIAPKARLQVLKACWQIAANGDARCNTFTLAKALTFVASARPTVVNLSLAGPPDPLLALLLERIMAQGSVVVGSLSPAMEPSFPTSVPGVVAVSSAPVTDRQVIVAPGEERLSTRPQNTYDFYSGNSMATAYVSGVTALLHGEYPDDSAVSLVRRLQQPAQDCVTQLLLNQAGTSVKACP